MRLTPAGWFWTTYVGMIGLIVTLGFCGQAKAAVPEFPLAHPICPTGFCVAQEYLEWKRVNGRLEIVKRTWVVYPATHRKVFTHSKE